MDPFEIYLTKALLFLKIRPRSEKEIKENLKKWARGSSASGGKQLDKIIEQVLITLREKKFVNDEEFAKWWVRQRVVFRPKSARVIRMELFKKGISKEYIDTALSSEIEEGGKPNDFEQARKIVEKKIGKYKHLPKYELYQKLGGFLSRRGFDWDTIKRSIDAEFE